MRFGHLREEVGVSFFVSFGSPTAGNSMVAELNKKGLIDDKETLIASLVTSFPATFIFVRDLTPVLVILLGTTGIIYLGIVVGVGLLRTAISLAFGRFLLPPKKIAIIQQNIKTKKFSAALQKCDLIFMGSPPEHYPNDDNRCNNRISAHRYRFFRYAIGISERPACSEISSICRLSQSLQHGLQVTSGHIR